MQRKMAPNNRRIQVKIFLFIHGKIRCAYSLEASHRGASNEYPQHIFSWREK